MSTVKLGVLLRIGKLSAARTEGAQQLLTDVCMRHFTTTKAHSDLNPVALTQELHCVLELDIEVIGVDAGRHTNLLYLDNMLIFPGFFFFFKLIKAKFAVIHNFADRRHSGWRNFYEVKTLFFCQLQCRVGGHDSKHGSVISNDSDFLITDVGIDLVV